jgi:LysR family hydrogen peroxide-inducible transcriptional activator
MTPLPTVRQAGYLVALADHKHFGRAAAACFVTQSTLSAGIKELESLLAVTLVERNRRRVLLTPLGKVMAARARELLRIAGEMAELAQSAAAPLSGWLRLGVIPTIGPFLPALRRDHPQLHLYLREDLSARLIDRLEAGELDALVLALPYATGSLELAPLGIDPFVLACPADHPLAALDEVPSEHLRTDELILLEEGHCLTDQALAACRLGAGRNPRGIGVQGSSLATIIQMVVGGLGITLLPRLAVTGGALAGTGLVTRPLAGGPARRLALAWRSTTTRATDFRLLSGRLVAVL